MKNINPKNNPVTTLLGFFLLVLATGMLVLPLVYEVKDELDYWIPISIGLLGMCFLLIPDDVIGFLKKILQKKGDGV